MLKRLFSTSMIKIALVGGGNAISAGLGLFFLAAVARSLTLEDFGRYALLTSILVSLSRLMDFGTNSTFVAGSISQSPSLRSSDEKLQSEHSHNEYTNDTFLSTKILMFFITIPIYSIITIAFGLFSLNILLIFILGQIGYMANYAFYAYYQKEQRFFELVMLNGIPAVIKGLFALAIITGTTNISMLSAYTIFSATTLTSFLFYFFIPKEFTNFKRSVVGIPALIKKAYPAGIAQMIYEGWPAINNSIAKIIRGFGDVGIFSLANKISSVFTLISFSIFTVLLPKNADRKKKQRLYDFKEAALISIGIILFSVLAIIVSEVFVETIFGEKFTDSVKLIDILIFANAFIAIHTFMENYFFVEDKTKYILYINLIKIGVFGLGVVSLMGTYQLMGLAVANLLSAIAALLATYIFIKRSHERTAIFKV